MEKSGLLLATQNQGKLSELRSLLVQRAKVLGLSDIGSSIPEVLEDGSTYFENALKKAIAYHRWSAKPVLSDDSGLEIRALQGKPGVHSATFGGENLSWAERWEYVLNQLRAIPDEERQARFRCVLCFYDGRNVPVFFEGVADGQILKTPKGSGGFGYDPLIYSHDLKKSFAEGSREEKNRVSHRAKALRAFIEWLDQGGAARLGS